MDTTEELQNGQDYLADYAKIAERPMADFISSPPEEAKNIMFEKFSLYDSSYEFVATMGQTTPYSE